MNWLIEDSVVSDLAPLYESLKKHGVNYKHTPMEGLRGRNPYDFFSQEACVLFFGSLQTAVYLRDYAWKPNVYYNPTAFKCTHYYPAMGELLINREYMMMPYGEVLRNTEFIFDTLGESRAIFVRPDREDKPFTGKVIFKEHFQLDIERLGWGKMDHHELMILARPINLIREWRFICVKGNVVTGSMYRKNDRVNYEAGFDDEALKMAQEAAKRYNPDDVWVIDVALTKSGRYGILETGCFSCAGLYLCDHDVIVSEINQLF